MICAGIDAGSRAVKAVLVDSRSLATLGSSVLELFAKANFFETVEFRNTLNVSRNSPFHYWTTSTPPTGPSAAAAAAAPA